MAATTEQSNQKRWVGLVKLVALTLLLASAGLLVGWLVGRWLMGNKGVSFGTRISGLQMALLVLLALLAMQLMVVLHEAGHLIGGALAGYRFQLFVLGPLLIIRDYDHRIRFKLNRQIHLAGGAALALPPDGNSTPRALLSMLVGGPLTSLIVALILGLYIWIADTLGKLKTEPLGELVVSTLLITSFVGSLAIAIVTLIPTRMGMMASDGFRILNLLRNTRAAAYDVALVGVIAAAQAGRRPSHWNTLKLDHLVQADAEPTSESLTALLFLYYVYLDTGRAAEAVQCLDNALQSPALHKVLRPTFALERAYCAAIFEHDTAHAEQLLTQVGSHYPEKHSLLRAQAAVAAASNSEDRDAKLYAARTALGARKLQPDALAFETELLDRIAALHHTVLLMPVQS